MKHEREREQYGSIRRVDWSGSAHTGLSRGVPGDHEAQSQVKPKTAAKVKVLGRCLTRRALRIHDRGSLPRANKRDKSHQNT